MADFQGLLFLRGVETIEDMPIASGAVVAIGDLVKTTGTIVAAAAATTDDLTVIGVAKEAHGATDPAGSISVAIRNGMAIYRATLDTAATVTIGELLQMHTSHPSYWLTPSNTDAVACVVKPGTLVATCEVILMTPNVTNGPRFVGDVS